MSCIIHDNINTDKPTVGTKNFQSFSLVRKLEGTNLPPNVNEQIRGMKTNVFWFQNERQLLEQFINKIQIIDPDIITAHNLCGGIFETLIARIQFLKINHWSRLGRKKRSELPKIKNDQVSSYSGGLWLPRQVTCGRLMCDTCLSARELIRETNYTLGNLA